MNKLILICTLALSSLGYAQSHSSLSPEQREKIRNHFDKDGDGKLNAQERVSARAALESFRKGKDSGDASNATYRYLENDGVTIYYETDSVEAYKKLIPKEFNLPSRCLVHAFIIDFYKIDNGLPPYKENAINILVEYKGKEFWHCVYMPVTDEHSLRAGVMKLGLPKTLGEIELERHKYHYHGKGINPDGGQVSIRVNTKHYELDEKTKKQLVELSKIRSIQILRGKVILPGRSGGDATNKRSIINLAEQYPNRLIMKFGKGSISTKTRERYSPLNLKPSKIIGAYYLKNTIPFSLTRDSYQ